jgi:hypothetical protein
MPLLSAFSQRNTTTTTILRKCIGVSIEGFRKSVVVVAVVLGNDAARSEACSDAVTPLATPAMLDCRYSFGILGAA